MTRLIEGLRSKCSEKHVSDSRFDAVLVAALQVNPEPSEDSPHADYHRWNDSLVAALYAAFPSELT
jgi:hypothetical protein